MQDIDELQNAIMDALTEAHDELRDTSGSKPWTSKLKTALCKLADLKNHPNRWAYANRLEEKLERGGGEWLYDVCWLDYKKEDKNGDKYFLLDMPLAAECEWGRDEQIRDDFQKLMLARAGLRVMIFEEWNKTNNGTANNLAELVKEFQGGSLDDRYLLAAYEGDGFKFFQIVRGRLEELRNEA